MKWKRVLSEDNVYLQTDNDRDDDNFSGRSHQFSKFIASKITCCREYGSEPRLCKCGSKDFSLIILHYLKALETTIFENISESPFTWEAKWTQIGMRFHSGWKSHFGVQSALYLRSHELRRNETQTGMDFISVILTKMKFQMGMGFSCEQNLPEAKGISADLLDIAFNRHMRF